MKAQSIYGCDSLGAIWGMGMLSSFICSTLVSMCAMKGIPLGPLAQWGKDLTHCLTPFFCLVNWGMYYLGSAMSRDGPASGPNTLHTYINNKGFRIKAYLSKIKRNISHRIFPLYVTFHPVCCIYWLRKITRRKSLVGAHNVWWSLLWAP